MFQLPRRDFLERGLRNWFDRYPRIAYIHVPKCAGTSAVESVYKAIYPKFMKATRLYGWVNLQASSSAEHLTGVEMMKARQIALINFLNDPLARFVSGHVYATPEITKEFGNWNFLTVLRNPVDRFVSEYVYNRFKSRDWMKVEVDFPEYVQSRRGSVNATTIARYFSGMDYQDIVANPDRAVDVSLDNLSRFSSVGFVEHLEEWLAGLQQLFGKKPQMPVRNKSPKPAVYAQIDASKELRERVGTLCEIDSRIYQAAKSRFRPGAVSAPR